MTFVEYAAKVFGFFVSLISSRNVAIAVAMDRPATAEVSVSKAIGQSAFQQFIYRDDTDGRDGPNYLGRWCERRWDTPW
jgi:hypothetical protein